MNIIGLSPVLVLAAAYMEFAKITPLSKEQHEHAFSVIFGICSGNTRQELETHLIHLPDDAFGKLTDICGYRYPVYDIQEEFPKTVDEPSTELLEFLSKFDIEDFPYEKQNFE